MIPGKAGLELSPDPHENLRRNHWSCLCRITSCSDIGKEVNVQLQANKTQSFLPSESGLSGSCKLHWEHGTFFLDRYEHQFTYDMWLDENACWSHCRWLCAFWKLMPWLKTNATIPHRTSCLTPGNYAFHKERFASGRETYVNWPNAYFGSFTNQRRQD